jgi:hypothetical protein
MEIVILERFNSTAVLSVKCSYAVRVQDVDDVFIVFEVNLTMLPATPAVWRRLDDSE